MLEKMGYQPYITSDGKQAEELFFNSPKDQFCAALLDYEMPVQNGIETAKKILQQNPLFPIIMVTAHIDKDECLKAGIFAFVPKPFTFQTLQQTLETAVPPRESERPSNKKTE